MHYDYLVVATGTTHAYFGHDEWAPHAPGLKTLEDAFTIRARILNAFEQAEMVQDALERDSWLTFVIVGGGPTGVELAGTLAEIARHTLKQEFRRIDPARSRVLLVEAGPRVLPTFPESLSTAAHRQLERLGVEVSTSRAITQVDAQGVRIGADFVAARTVLWAAGVAASPLGRSLGAEIDRAGRVRVAADLSIPAHPEIFLAGDLAIVTGPGALFQASRPRPSRWGATSRECCGRGLPEQRRVLSATAISDYWPPLAAWPPWWIWAGSACAGSWLGGSGCSRTSIS